MRNGFIKVFVNECKVFLKSPQRIFYTLVFPLMLFGFLSAVFYQEVPRDLPLAFLDLNPTQSSAKLIRMLDAAPSMAMAQSVTSEKEARELMQEGKIYGFILIPNDFQKKIYQGQRTTVFCYTNGQFLLPSSVIQREFQQVVGTYSAGVKIRRATANQVQSEKALADVQPVLLQVHTLFNPYSNYAFYLLTALFPMMLQMVVIMVTIYVIGVEFKNKTGKIWYAMSGENAWAALWGKLLPYTFCLFFVGWWMNYFLFRRIGVPLKTEMINVTLITFLLIIVYQLLGIVIASVLRDFRSALTIGSGFTAIAFSFAAYTFPVEGLPQSMQILAKVFPFTYYIEYFVNRAIKGIPIVYTWHALAALLGFVMVFILLYPQFIKRLKSGGYA